MLDTSPHTGLSDRDVRIRAVTEIEKNAFVLAGAGTGKTSLLALRMLYTLCHRMFIYQKESVPHPASRALRQIVAMTFTEKAANEMRLRIRDYMRIWLGEPVESGDVHFVLEIRDHFLDKYTCSAEELTSLIRNLKLHMAELRISTIHSFCLGLLREFPFSSPLPVQFEVVGDEDIPHAFLRRRWTSYIRAVLTQPHLKNRKKLLRKLYDTYDLDPQNLFEIVQKLAEYAIRHGSDHLFEQVQYEKDFDEAYMNRLSNGGFWTFLMNHVQEKKKRARKEETQNAYESFLKNLAQSQNSIIELRRLLRKSIRSTHSFREHVTKLFNHKDWKKSSEFENIVRRLPEFELPYSATMVKNWLLAVEHHLLRTVFACVKPFLKRIEREYWEKGRVTFYDIIYFALKMLKMRPEVLESVRKTIDVLLVDEFQDTSQAQIEIVRLICQDTIGKYRPGSLFIVGDPKQSIYAFRDADLASFQEFYHELKHEGAIEEYTLQTNFRSHTNLLDFINKISAPYFEHTTQPSSHESDSHDSFRLEFKGNTHDIVLPPKYLQPEYSPVYAFTYDIGPPPELYCFSNFPEHDKDERERIKAEWLATLILHLVEENHDVQWRDITLLFRSMRQHTFSEHLLQAFHQRGIPFKIEGDRLFYQRPEIIDAYLWFSAIAFPYNTSILLGLLRSPQSGLSDFFLLDLWSRAKKKAQTMGMSPHEIFQSASLEPWDDILSTSPDSYSSERLKSLIQLLYELREKSAHTSPSRLFQDILHNTSYLESHAHAPNGEQRIVNIWKLAHMIRGWEQQGILTPGQVATHLRTAIFTEKPESEQRLIDPELNMVQWMTIHKAKGLEFPVVILVDTEFIHDHYRSSNWGQHARIRLDRSQRLGLSVSSGTFLGTLTNSLFPFQNLLEMQVDQAEKARMLYVALTRAKHRLIMLCDCQKKRKTPVCMTEELFSTLSHVSIRAKPTKKPEMSDKIQFTAKSEFEQKTDFLDKRTLDQLKKQMTSEQRRRQTLLKNFARTPSFFLFPSETDKTTEPSEENETPETLLVIPEHTRDEALLTGSLVHEILARIPLEMTLENDLAWIDAELSLTRSWVEHLLEKAKDPQKILERARALLESFFHTPTWAYLKSHIIAREWPFFEPHSSQPSFWHGRIDVLVKENERTLIVGDYKTDPFDEKVLLKKYSGQLQTYIHHMIQVFPKCSVEGELIHIPTGIRVRVKKGHA